MKASLALALLVLTGCQPAPAHQAFGDPRRGARVVLRGACGSCHLIPGQPQADGLAGPSLSDFGARAVIGGVLANTPENLAQWLRDPQRFAPGSAMPADVLDDRDARDAAAYLESLGTS